MGTITHFRRHSATDPIAAPWAIRHDPRPRQQHCHLLVPEIVMTTAPYRIRRATRADAGDVASMCLALSRDEGGDAPNHFSADVYLRDGVGPARAFSCLIAEVGCKAVGYALQCSDYDTDHLCRSIYLADLYVEKAARSQGIGRALMAAAAQDGRAKGAQLMTWGVLRGNALARRFYARIGHEHPELIESHIGEPDLSRLAAEHRAAPGITVRPAVAADSALLASWLRALLAEIGEPRPPMDSQSRIRRDGFGQEPAFTSLIAERAGAPLGYALFWSTYDTETAGRGVWLSDLYVAPEARHDGVGRILMAAVAQQAVADNAKFIIWLVLERNHKARAFYRKFGQEWHDGFVCVSDGADFIRLADEAPPID